MIVHYDTPLFHQLLVWFCRWSFLWTVWCFRSKTTFHSLLETGATGSVCFLSQFSPAWLSKLLFSEDAVLFPRAYARLLRTWLFGVSSSSTVAAFLNLYRLWSLWWSWLYLKWKQISSDWAMLLSLKVLPQNDSSKPFNPTADLVAWVDWDAAILWQVPTLRSSWSTPWETCITKDLSLWEYHLLLVSWGSCSYDLE